MLADNFTITLAKNVGGSVLKHLVLWPLWWYTSGLLIILKATGRKIIGLWQGLALDVWLKNIFRPMYGQYDAASRIISFLMRLVQIVFRLIIMLVISAVIIVLPVVYLALPLLAIWQLVE